ncbi:hypothetical protein LTS17_008551 [Exophiala oligosperma]
MPRRAPKASAKASAKASTKVSARWPLGDPGPSRAARMQVFIQAPRQPTPLTNEEEESTSSSEAESPTPSAPARLPKPPAPVGGQPASGQRVPPPTMPSQPLVTADAPNVGGQQRPSGNLDAQDAYKLLLEGANSLQQTLAAVSEQGQTWKRQAQEWQERADAAEKQAESAEQRSRSSKRFAEELEVQLRRRSETIREQEQTLREQQRTLGEQEQTLREQQQTFQEQAWAMEEQIRATEEQAQVTKADLARCRAKVHEQARLLKDRLAEKTQLSSGLADVAAQLAEANRRLIAFEVLRCEICNLAFRNAYLPCGHTYCRVCIGQTLLQNPSCPHCRAGFQDDLVRTLYAGGDIDELPADQEMDEVVADPDTIEVAPYQQGTVEVVTDPDTIEVHVDPATIQFMAYQQATVEVVADQEMVEVIDLVSDGE